MELNYSIVPLHEARIYLMERFTDDRTSDRIEKLKSISYRMNNNDYAFFDSIAELQKELDELFEADELMRQYFTPLKTKQKQAGDIPITIGGMLLSLSGDTAKPYGFDELVAQYRAWPKDRLLRFFFMSSLAAFFADPDETEGGISGFVAAADELLTDYKDKWALIDAATNPFPHLERLRPLVTKVSEAIEQRSKAFEPYLKKVLNDLTTYGNDEKILRDILKVELPEKWVITAVFHLSLLSFNGFKFYSSPGENADSPDSSIEMGEHDLKILVIGGVYMGVLTRNTAGSDKPDPHIDLLKKISDPMRFNILHDMCDKETYGQELAEKYHTTRSAMYYHLEKLMGEGLIQLRSSDYRMLYTMNKRNVYNKLNALRDYLTNGWKPEDEE